LAFYLSNAFIASFSSSPEWKNMGAAILKDLEVIGRSQLSDWHQTFLVCRPKRCANSDLLCSIDLYLLPYDCYELFDYKSEIHGNTLLRTLTTFSPEWRPNSVHTAFKTNCRSPRCALCNRLERHAAAFISSMLWQRCGVY